jgi:acyl-coenzyme A synthetase/AMP-(fatty) acid ligase
VFQLVDAAQVTHFCGAPTVLISLATNRPSEAFRFPRRVRIVTAAAPPPPAVIQQIEEMGADITHVYGLTEVYGPHTICQWKREWDDLPAAERARLKARQGVCYLHAPELRVVDDQMRDVAAQKGCDLARVSDQPDRLWASDQRRGGDRHGFPRRLVPQRRSGSVHPGRLPRAAQSEEGHHHQRR